MENFFDKRLKIIIIVTFGILAIFLLIQSAGAVIDISMKKKMAEKVSNFKSHNITFRGTADIDVTPDTAAFTVTVREEGVTAIEAQQKMTEKSNKAMELFKKSGIDKADIQTKNYNTHPKYNFKVEPCLKAPCEPSKPTISGYEASQSISIKLRDITKAGEITTAIAQLEISDVRGPSFSVEDASKFKLQAQAEAIKKVKEEALVTAKNLGVTLGEVVSFSEDPQYPSFSMAKMSGDMRGGISPDLEAGKQKISSTVSITYEIKQ